MADDQGTPADPATEPDPEAADDATLGDAGKNALKAERTRAATAERNAKALQRRLDELETANLSEVDRAIKEAKDAARAEALAEVGVERVKDKVEAAAGGKLADPDLAPALLGDLTRFVGDDGSIDKKAISTAIDELVKDKPYLAPNGATGRPTPLPGGGSRPPAAGNPINEALRSTRR